jgi:hypothetical protein
VDPEGVPARADLEGVVNVPLESLRLPRRRCRSYWKAAAWLGLLGLVAAVGLIVRARPTDPPFLAPAWVPDGLSVMPSQLTFTNLPPSTASVVSYGHQGTGDGLDGYLELSRIETSPLDSQESADLSAVATRNGRTVWQNNASDDDRFLGYVEILGCGFAAVDSKGIVTSEVIAALLGARCTGQYVEVERLAETRELCRRSTRSAIPAVRRH